MKWIEKVLWSAMLLMAASCASLQDQEEQRRPMGRVVGTITYESSIGEYRIGLVRSQQRPVLIRIGSLLWHPFVKMHDEDLKMRGEPFSMVLPAGDYRMAFWEVAQGQARSTSRDPIDISFRVDPGKATYLGNLHFSAQWQVSLRDEAARDVPILRSRFPELADMPVASAIEPGAEHPRIGGGYAGVLMGRGFDPGHPFRLGSLNVNAPLSGGWERLRSVGPGIVLARRGEAEEESQVAHVAVVSWTGQRAREDFIAAVRQRLEADSSDRFLPIESAADYTEERGYPCVRYRSASQDTQARVSASKVTSLRLEMLSLVCLPSSTSDLAFIASYTSRTAAGDPSFLLAAESFIQGVRSQGR